MTTAELAYEYGVRDGVLLRSRPGDPASRTAWMQGTWQSYPDIDKDWWERLPVTGAQAEALLTSGQVAKAQIDAIIEAANSQIQTIQNTLADQLKTWDESQHPRHPAGSEQGGEFASAEGSGTAAAVDLVSMGRLMKKYEQSPYAQLTADEQGAVRGEWIDERSRAIERQEGVGGGTAVRLATAEWDALSDESRNAEIQDMLGPILLRRVPDALVLAKPDGADADHPQDSIRYAQTARLGKWLVLERGAEQLAAARGEPVNAGHRMEIRTTQDRLWAAWKDSSTSPDGNALQVAAADLFGVSSPRVESARQDTVRLSRDQSERNTIYVKALYETTQFLMAKANVHSLDVYRAVILPKEMVGSTRSDGPVPLTLERNGLASTTLKADVANEWTGIGQAAAARFHAGTDVRVVLRSRVPAGSIVSLPLYGANVYNENEVVVAGTDWNNAEAWVGTAPTFEKVPYQGHPPKMTKSTVPPSLFISLWDLEPGPGGEWLQQAPPSSMQKGWDESQHPRHPAGSPEGGEFAESGGVNGQIRLERTTPEIQALYERFRLLVEGKPAIGPGSIRGEAVWALGAPRRADQQTPETWALVDHVARASNDAAMLSAMDSQMQWNLSPSAATHEWQAATAAGGSGALSASVRERLDPNNGMEQYTAPEDRASRPLTDAEQQAFAARTAFVRAWARAKWGDQLTVYRGITGPQARKLANLNPGDAVDLGVYQLSSWSDSPPDPYFSSGKGGKKKGAIVSMAITPDDVWLVPRELGLKHVIRFMEDHGEVVVLSKTKTRATTLVRLVNQ